MNYKDKRRLKILIGKKLLKGDNIVILSSKGEIRKTIRDIIDEYVLEHIIDKRRLKVRDFKKLMKLKAIKSNYSFLVSFYANK
jgi:hypothetical protein